jgi:hypothetical protein
VRIEPPDRLADRLSDLLYEHRRWLRDGRHGFNLYYEALKGTSNKWLDLEAWCARLLPGYSVDQILY